MCCIAKILLYLALVFNFVFHSALPMCCMLKTYYICPWCWTYSLNQHCWWTALQKTLILGACGELPLLFGTTDVLHCKKLLYLALICFELRLSFRTAHELHCETPFIFGALCSITSFVCHLWCSAMKKRLMFGACFALPLLFVTFHLLTCKIPLLFCACVDLRHLFSTLDVCCNTT